MRSSPGLRCHPDGYGGCRKYGVDAVIDCSMAGTLLLCSAIAAGRYGEISFVVLGLDERASADVLRTS